ncbi:hypothetical protein C4855_17695 [Salmonella enterica subsp. enterica serovar Gaminara]|uniref:Uncharacterized protein n=1 Tax=Salmonella enterica subsp. enterica serovar Gaminara TaxID=913070 RepID=A0A2T8X3C8_SALET|nr:hypothetical protein C4855_17695 [Salmonella enterica subsp. enterica serovar Gaminara]
MAFRFPQIILFLLAAMLFCPGSYAEQKPTAAQEARKTAVEVAVEGMSRAAVAGPTKISLGDKATLNLPEGFTWILKRGELFKIDLQLIQDNQKRHNGELFKIKFAVV